MPAEPANQVQPKPWWQSKTILGLVVTALGPILAQHLGFTDAETEELVGALAVIVGVALGVYGRRKATQPIGLGAKPATTSLWLVALIGTAILTSCATSPATKAKWTATGSWLLAKAQAIALDTIVAAAQSQLDAEKKADWMDSLATGLRVNAVANFSGEDVRTLIGIWTPQKPHWSELGAQLGELAKQAATLPPTQRNEALAAALNLAAQAARVKSATLPAGPTTERIAPVFRGAEALIVTRMEEAR